MTSIVIWLILVPIIVYVATYVGRIQDATFFAAPWSEESWFRHVWQKQVDMLNFHSNLTSTHSYQSPPWSWPLLKRPVAYEFTSFQSGGREMYQEIFAAGNPFVWWSGLLALGYTSFRWLRRRRWPRAEGVILAGFLFSFAPWLLLDIPSDRSAVFIFYFLPAVPFMCLALGFIATNLGSSWEARAAVSLFTAGTIGLFAFYYPLTANVPLPREDWQKRIWIFQSDGFVLGDCDKPTGVTTTVTTTETSTGGEVIVRTSESSDNGSLPPVGWCWI